MSEFPQLHSLGLKACDIRGDGNCLFNALSDQLYGHQNKHQEIRRNVVQYLRDYPDGFKPFITIGEGQRRNPKRKNTGAFSSQFSFETATEEQTERAFQDHLERMSKNGTYGGNVEIQAFSKAYNTDLKIFQYDLAYYVRSQDDGVDRPIAYIAYHTWEHYSSIRNIDGPFTGLPEVREKDLLPEEVAKLKAATPKTAPIQDWMIKNIMTATSHLLLDEATIRQKLQENGGNVDTTLNKLLDSGPGYLSSNPPSPGSYSQSGSSSIERDADSDDDAIYGPNKRQNRRIRTAKLSSKRSDLATNMDPDIHVIPTIELTEPDSQITSQLPAPSQLPPLTPLPAKSVMRELPGAAVIPDDAPVRKTKKVIEDDDWVAPSDDDNDDDFRPDEDNDVASSYSASSRSVSVSFGSTPPPRVTLKLNIRHNKSMQKQNGPQKKKPTARERKDLKKAAQKQARKESKRGNRKTQPQPATRNSPPMEQVIGMKTLYI